MGHDGGRRRGSRGRREPPPDGITVGVAAAHREPPDLIGRSLIEDETGEPITFFEWFLMALRIVVVMFVALLVVILWLNRPEVKRVEGVEEFIAEEKGKLGRVSKGERNTLIAFGVAITLWTLPGAGRPVPGRRLLALRGPDRPLAGRGRGGRPGRRPAVRAPDLIAITIVWVVIAVIISETTSNTASAAIVVPIAIAISGAVASTR